MIYKNLDLHGINALIGEANEPLFSRLPDSVNKAIGHTVAYEFVSGEIRLVPLGTVRIVLEAEAINGAACCLVFHGDFAEPQIYTLNGPTEIIVEPLKKFDTDVIATAPYISEYTDFALPLVRLVFVGASVRLLAVSGDYRQPRADEVPQRKLLAYGTSITQGVGATAPDMTYPWQLGRRLGFDVYNYGLSGKCLIEPEVADFLANSGNYQVVILELSVNMLALGYSAAEFSERAGYLLAQLRAANPRALIYCIGIFPYWREFGFENPGQIPVSNAAAYREALKSLVDTAADAKIRYIDGRELLSVHNLSADFIHPSNDGMNEIADHLAKIIKSDSKDFSIVRKDFII